MTALDRRNLSKSCPALTLILLALALALCLLSRLSAAAELCPIQPLDPNQPAVEPLALYCYLEDSSASLSAEDILSGRHELKQAQTGELVFPATDSRFWIYLRVHNLADRWTDWYLLLEYALLDNLTFYQISGDRVEVLETGDTLPFASRAVEYPYFLLPMKLEADEYREVLISIRSKGALSMPLSLHQPDQLVEQVARVGLAHGIFYGALLILVLFNAVLFLSTGTSSYFYNGFYMLCTGLFLFSMSGLAYQYLWPSLPWLANKAIPLSESLAILSFTLFGRSFLEIDRKLPKSHYITLALIGLSVVSAVLALAAPYDFAIKWATVFGLVAIGTLYIIGFQRWRQGYLPAKWYLASWTLMGAGSLIYALAAFGHVADYLANQAVMQAAVVAQVLLLNYALTLQVRYLNDRVLHMQTAAKQELEQQVDQRTRELRTAMDELETANHKLTELSTRDQLTGLHNRRYLDDALARAFSESRRSGMPLALMLLDADHFKAVNDTYGHGVGDECLVHLARVLETNVRRPGDTLARFGGEEFAVLLPNTDAEGACHVAQGIRDSLARQPVRTSEQVLIPLTLSAGIALTVVNADSTITDFFEAADQALYQAKRKGRDRIEIFQQLEAPEPSL